MGQMRVQADWDLHQGWDARSSQGVLTMCFSAGQHSKSTSLKGWRSQYRGGSNPPSDPSFDCSGKSGTRSFANGVLTKSRSSESEIEPSVKTEFWGRRAGGDV
jgi:hypothetical protein